jgi:DNA polymerase III epsilon subunit-like protein
MSPHAPLRGLPCAVVDFETTGLPGTGARVVSLAVVHTVLGATDDARVVLSSLVRPPIPIPAVVTEIHGITDAAVAHAPTWDEIADAFEAACEDRVVVAYNAPADYDFHAVEQDIANRERLEWPWLDLLVVRKATKTRGAPGRLTELAQEHGIVLDAHGAAGDALTTALLLTPLMRAAWTAGAFSSAAGAQPKRWSRYGDDGYDVDDYNEDDEPAQKMETWGAFSAWQREAALYQERDFSAYRLRTGQRRPENAWHKLEGVEPPAWPESVTSAPCGRCGASVRRTIGKDGAVVTVNADGAAHLCESPR